MKKYAYWAIGIAVAIVCLLYIIDQPVESGRLVRNFLETTIGGFLTFLSELAK